MNQFRLVQAIDGFSRRVIVAAPRLPTDDSIPASARCSLYGTLTYWDPLTGRLATDLKTIADFRRDSGSAIRNPCRRFVEMCRGLKLCYPAT